MKINMASFQEDSYNQEVISQTNMNRDQLFRLGEVRSMVTSNLEITLE